MGLGMTVNSASTAKNCGEWVNELFKKHKWLKISIETKRRSLDSNALSHVWYGEIARFMSIGREEAHDYCKLNFGVPILRADPKPNAFFQAIGFDEYSYPKQMAAMKYIQVTSLFSTTQMTEYLNAVQRHFAEHGLELVSK